MKRGTRTSGLWPLALMVCLFMAASSPSSAAAAIVIESPNSEFSGSGSVKFPIGLSTAYYVKCTSAAVKGSVTNPPTATATFTQWSPSSCATYDFFDVNVGTASVEMLKLPKAKAQSLSQLSFSEVQAKATFKYEGSTCSLKFSTGEEPYSALASYVNGSTTNSVAWSTSANGSNAWFSPYPCPAGGGGFADITFSFSNPQFEVTELPEEAEFLLRNSNSTGSPDVVFKYGLLGDRPVIGDWNKNASATVGIKRGSTFYLRNSNSSGSPDLTFSFGEPEDLPIAGDWNNDGTDTIGVYRPSNRTFYLRNSNSGGAVDITVDFGNNGDLPIAGDWNNDGTDTIGVYRPSNRTFYMRNSNSNGAADIAVDWGNPGDLPIVGDWNNDGTDTFGVYRPGSTAFYMRNSNSSGAADISAVYGSSGDAPIVGDWNGDGTTTIGVFR
jgi:hypothetical protein